MRQRLAKTFVSVTLLCGFTRYGLRAAAIQPIATGIKKREGYCTTRIPTSSARPRQRRAAARDPHASHGRCCINQARGCNGIDGHIDHEFRINNFRRYERIRTSEVRNPFHFVLTLDLCNNAPLMMKVPAAPHIVAAQEGLQLEIDPILASHAQACAAAPPRWWSSKVCGFFVPLDDTLDKAHLAVALTLPVVLVVGVRLGCINHALLTTDARSPRADCASPAG